VAQELIEAGFARENISIMANDASGEYGNLIGTDVEAREANVSGTAAGAGIGAALGGGVGLLVGLGALAIPGIGPVIAAGPVLSALATAGVGAGVGAVAGGLVGALVDMGVPEEEAEYYAEGVRRGGALLTVHTPDEAEARAMHIINRSQAVDLDERSKWWRERGWRSFDPSATPYTPGDVAQEQASYQAYSSGRNLSDDPNAGSRGWPEVEPAPGESTYRGDVTDNPDVESRGWTEVEPAPGEDTYRGDVTDNPGYQSRGWTEVEPPEGEGRADIDLSTASYTWEETKDDVREGWEETKEAVRQGWEETKEAVDFDDDYDSEYDTRFREHFANTYAGQGYSYELYAPAYRYGYDLAYDPDYEDRNWDEFEPEARQYWESNYEGAWDQFKAAVRHAWEETKEALGFEEEDDELNEVNRQRRSGSISQF
jgi:hypothetical protein